MSETIRPTNHAVLDVIPHPGQGTPLPEVYYTDPEPRQIPESSNEPSTFIDTMGLKLDRLLSLVHGSQAYFDAKPQIKTYTYIAHIPSDDLKARGQDYTFSVTRDSVDLFRHMAFDVYTDLRDHSPIGHELAQDIAKSWEAPEGYVLEPNEEVEVKRS